MRRYDLGDNIVEIKHSDGSDRWLVIKKMLDASKISLQVSVTIYNCKDSHKSLKSYWFDCNIF